MEIRRCDFPDCDRTHIAHGLCKGHLSQRAKGRELVPLRRRRGQTCSFPECGKDAVTKGLCSGHLEQQKKHAILSPLYSTKVQRHQGDLCIFPNCGNIRRVKAGWCSGHQRQIRRGETPHAFKSRYDGSPTITVHGYRDVYLPVADRTGKAKRIHEHRLVMMRHLGRNLFPGENVHHINGDKLDNRIENLELWSTSQPAGQRVEDKLAWAREILALYSTD